MEISLSIVFSTFLVIFISELIDKTSLATIVLATKFKIYEIIIGAWLAYVIQTIIAIFGGSFLLIFPNELIHVVSGIVFLIFAYVTYKNKNETVAEEKSIINKSLHKKRKPAIIQCFLVIFTAEWGDLTQLATIAIVARTQNPISVGIGSLAALWSVCILAIFVGTQLTKVLSPLHLYRITAVLYVMIGFYMIFSAL